MLQPGTQHEGLRNGRRHGQAHAREPGAAVRARRKRQSGRTLRTSIISPTLSGIRSPTSRPLYMEDKQRRRFRLIEPGEGCIERLPAARDRKIARHHVEHQRRGSTLAQRDNQPVARQKSARAPTAIENRKFVLRSPQHQVDGIVEGGGGRPARGARPFYCLRTSARSCATTTRQLTPSRSDTWPIGCAVAPRSSSPGRGTTGP